MCALYSLCDMTKVCPLLDLVHRDLAARNVLIGRGLQAKVSDYGFSRHTAIKMESESCYYKMSTMRALPVRWTVRWWWKVVERDCSEGVCACSSPFAFCLDQAPEVLLSRKISSSSDVWSFGCLIIEAFTRGKVGGAGHKL